MFGGGDPAPVVLHLSSKSPLSESLTLSVLLVDETEEGYYVLTKPGERRAYFLRRDLVSVVEFGRGGQDSPSTRER